MFEAWAVSDVPSVNMETVEMSLHRTNATIAVIPPLWSRGGDPLVRGRTP